MDTERSGLDEAMDVGSSTISHLKSLKTAATFSKAGYGAALGGPFSAAIGAVIANRNQFAKILLVILAILLLPVLFIVMLPGLIFGSLTDQSDVLNSNSMISENIRASRDAIVEVLEESHEDILAEIHAAISRLPQGDTASINDPYTYSIAVNANLLISQFCASQDDYKNINLNQLKKLIRENKEGLFSYDVATETVTMEVTVDGGAEGETGTEQGQAQTQTVTFTKHTYTVVYAGDSYFADHVFHLTDKQKELAKNYAENLTAFFGTASSGIVAAINLSDEVLSYRPAVERAAAKYGMSDYVDLILAVMMQESGGRGLDVMQAAEGGFNTRYPHVPNGITDPEYSIECGVQELKYALDKAGCTGPTDLDRIKLALQGYNYGSAYIDWAMERDGGYTKENAIAYSDMMCARPSWPYDRYGDKEYVDHVLRYYQITASGGNYPANGMQIPHYLQTDYGNIPYGGGSIASSGCGPTSFAIYFPGIGTTAKDKADGDQEAVATKEVTIIDTVSYQNLIPDTPYKLVGTLMDKTTQKEVLIDGKPVTAETEFTPKDSNGSVEVIFTFDGSTLAGHDVVVFEKLFSLEGETALEIASHEDLDDKGQTIKLTEVPKDTPEPSKPVKTGDETTILPYLLLAGAALLFAAGFGILYIRKRKKDK